MKRITIMLLCLLAGIGAQAQTTNPDCMGLQNPTNFALYSSPITGMYSAQVGEVLSQVSTCTTPGMTFVGSELTGTQISDAVGGSSCEGSAVGADYQKQFVIKYAGNDPLTGNRLSFLPDSTFTSSIRIGNGCGGTQANALYYDFRVSANNALVYIYFAISLQNSLHTANYNPEFAIKVKKLNAETNQYETISDTLCYIVQSPTSNNNLGVFQNGASGNIYRPWEQVVINLYNLLYQYVRIEITTGDCAYSQHYGYGYVAGKCGPMALEAVGCAAGTSDTVATISAPTGLTSYQWYAAVANNGLTVSENYTNDYVLMQGRTDSLLCLLSEDFVLPDGTAVDQRTFLCKMVSYMNPSLPIASTLITNVGSMKPAMRVDSVHTCDGNVYLKDLSSVAFTGNNDSNRVDTNYTFWRIYSSLDTNATSLLDSARGPSMSYTFDEPGEHAIMVRTHSYYHDECWNEKKIVVRSLTSPTPKLTFDKTTYCIGDTVTIMDETKNPLNEAQYSAWREYIVHRANGIDTIIGDGNLPGARRLRFVVDSTITRVQMKVRTNQVTYRDTNMDGVVDPIYCFSYIDTIVPAERYPVLTVSGDTIVCYGNSSEVSVANANSETTNYGWYVQLNGTNTLGTNTDFSEPNVTTNKTYFVKATTERAKCTTWDSISITLVEPVLRVPVDEMCTDDFVYLYGEGASSYTWTAMPDDPTLNPQGNGDTVRVSPRQNTTYTLVGHGTNGCSANPLTAYVKVYPYPVPTFTLNPGFIDSEDPVVTFTDVSPNSTTSLWDFGNGVTSRARSVAQRFSDISQDSVLISLTSGNALGCTSDTSFYVRIDLFAVWFPNAFTPTMNSNRTFHVYTHNELQYFSLYIYDRRGQLVFQTTDQNKAWDGTHKGKLCDQGSYVYVCNYRRDGLNEITTLKGTVLLLQ